MITYHAIVTSNGKVDDFEIEAEDFDDAVRKLHAARPDVTYWEIGVPLVENPVRESV